MKWNKKHKVALFFCVSYIILIPIINEFMKLLEKCFQTNLHTIDINLLNLFTVIFRNRTILVTWVILNLIIILVVKNINTTRKNSKIEIEGINLKNKDGTYGTADWGSKEEIQKVLSIGKRDGIIIGETDEGEIITLPMDTALNKNIAVFGSSGSRKSRGFAIPNGIELAQEELQKAIGREMSLVFTDPKGELYKKLTKYLESKGYDVKVFNLVNPIFSNGANFVKFVEDETDAQIFSQIVIEGTQLDRKAGGDEFWNRGEQNLLKALLLYVLNYVKEEENKSISYIYDCLASGNIKQIDKLFMDTSGPTKLSYNIYAQATDIVKQSIVTGLATRLQVFQTDKIRNITNKDEIKFEDIGNKKTCIFVVTSDTNSAFDFLSTLFFSFLFIKLIKQADENQDGKLKVETALILDEFLNIGRIVDFEKKLATTRSRGIDICMIFQNIPQLENRYGINVGHEILGNADTKIFMGAGDIVTARFISTYLGVSTVETNAIRKEAGFDGNFTYGMQNLSTNKRNLMNDDEILKLDNNKEIVIERGQQPFICNKYDYSKHSEADKLEDMTLEEQMERFKDNVERNKAKTKYVEYSFEDF